ncbi:hypothetical protein EYF80_023559 [Liparis tanakae]|uniref:Uncharacterized protein n=1 Tax=Liparis tanakae TaxID=230148 RepID=A0A4Z2HKZ6_9TELE|nr:hypothetical protein EYF80_023559 [Liparis tanakae]
MHKACSAGRDVTSRERPGGRGEGGDEKRGKEKCVVPIIAVPSPLSADDCGVTIHHIAIRSIKLLT